MRRIANIKRVLFGVRSNEEGRSRLDKLIQDVYTSTMSRNSFDVQPSAALFDVPCACQNLRRATRVVTRIYDQELRRAGLEITQFGLLTALAKVGEANQKRLSAGFAMDSTTLTRTLRLMLKQGWVPARRGKDRRERPFTLAGAGRRQEGGRATKWEGPAARSTASTVAAGWDRLA